MAKGNLASGMAGAGSAMGGGVKGPSSMTGDMSIPFPGTQQTAGKMFNSASPLGGQQPSPLGGLGGGLYNGGSEGPGGFTGHAQDPNYNKIAQQPQLSQQDMINTRNRINELSQFDPRYPVPFAGRNMDDPRNNELDVLNQRMNQWHQQNRMDRGSPMPPRRFDMHEHVLQPPQQGLGGLFQPLLNSPDSLRMINNPNQAHFNGGGGDRTWFT